MEVAGAWQKVTYPRLASFGLSYILLLFVLRLVDVRRIPFMEVAGAWQLVLTLPCRVRMSYVCLTHFTTCFTLRRTI
jgi:hypothetical protein